MPEQPEPLSAAQGFLILAYAALGFVFLTGALFDLWLHATGRPTITSTWRNAPAWFWAPWSLCIIHLVILAIHVLFPQR
jgi:hypothetical protein